MADVSDQRRVALDVLAVVVVTAALWYALGPFGLAIGGIVAITSTLASPVYAFGVGQVLFVVLATTIAGGLPQESLVVAQAGLAALLLVILVGHWPRRTAIVTTIGFIAAAVGFATLYTLEPIWLGAAILAVGYAVTAYTMHRYELVRLGLVTEADG